LIYSILSLSDSRYDPAAVTTSDGHLTIVLSEQPTHNLNFQGGFVSSWNKLCVTGGLIEASIQLPGYSDHGGLWPGEWKRYAKSKNESLTHFPLSPFF